VNTNKIRNKKEKKGRKQRNFVGSITIGCCKNKITIKI
jgi:hypothetical protein